MVNGPLIKGIYTALVTPFTVDGAIDWPAFDRLLQLQAAAEVDGVVISGTTGETPTLSVDEKVSLFRRARTSLPRSVALMAGTGGNCTRQSLELSKLAQDAGADSLLIVTPPYNKPSLAGLKAHYETIGRAVRIPLCLYHVPGRTGQRLNAEELISLCAIPQVLAVKEASADLWLFSKARQGSDATYLSGDDFTYLPSLTVGGEGVISVVTNVFPRAFVLLQRRFRAGDLETARAIHDVLMPFTELLFAEASPGPAKAILAHAGLIENSLRLPLAPVLEHTFAKLKESYAKTKQDLAALEAL